MSADYIDVENRPPRETATKRYFEKFDPVLWEKLSALSPRERDNRWFELTQIHLSPYDLAYDQGDAAVTELISGEKFKEEERELALLNFFDAERLNSLPAEMKQIGWIFTPDEGSVRFRQLGDLMENVRSNVKSDKFSVLVTGVGIVGKATVRTVLTAMLTEQLPEKVVVSTDRDYEKVFPPVVSGDVTIVEDVHGLDRNEGELERFDGKDGFPGGYDLTVQVLRLPRTYKQTLLNRGKAWAESGKVDLSDPNREVPESVEELLSEVADDLSKTDEVSRAWNLEYLKTIMELKNRGKMVAIVDPTEMLVNLGYIAEPERTDSSFLELLQKRVNIQRAKASLERIRQQKDVESV